MDFHYHTQETISMLEELSGTAKETVASKAGSEFLSYCFMNEQVKPSDIS